MQKRELWKVVPIEESWERTGKAPVSVRWVDTNKGGPEEWLVRSRLVARDFKGNDKWRDDLFAGRYACYLVGRRLGGGMGIGGNSYL